MGKMQMRLLVAIMVSVCVLGNISCAAQDSDRKKAEGEVSYERVLELTLDNSLKIVLADEQVDSAMRALRNAKRRRLPRVSVQGWFSGDLFEIERWAGDNLGSYLTLDWDFYQDGAIMHMIAQSWANLTNALFSRRRTVSEEIYSATSLFYEAVKARRQVEIAQENVMLDEMQLGIARSLFSQGRKTRSELGDAEARFFESQLALTRAHQDSQRAIENLRQLTRDQSILSIADLPREITWTLDFSLQEAMQTALQHQPSVLIAQSNLKLAHVGVKYAKIKRWPSVRFLTGTDYAFAPMARPEEFGFRVGVIVSYPLYDAGDRKSRIEDANSAVKLAQIQLWQAQDQMKQEVTDNYSAVSNQLDLLRPAEKRHDEVATNFAVAQQQYKEKRIDDLEMARIRLQYLQSVERMESLRLDALLAHAKLLKSAGISATDQINAYPKEGAQEEK